MKYKGRLQPEEREQISLMLSNNSTMMQIAAVLNRSASTIGREVYRSTRQVDTEPFRPIHRPRNGSGIHTGARV
jgi:IS30 family transposase